MIVSVAALAAFALAGHERKLIAIERTAVSGSALPAALCDPSCSPRIALALARQATIDTAVSGVTTAHRPVPRNRYIDRALAQRPFWSNAVTERALWLSVAAPRSPVAVAAFDASYRSSPYSRATALWRATLAADEWRNLSPATREQAIAEVVWYAGIDYSSREAMLSRIGGTPLEVALLARGPQR